MRKFGVDLRLFLFLFGEKDIRWCSARSQLLEPYRGRTRGLELVLSVLNVFRP
jgi:hypothetical protein